MILTRKVSDVCILNNRFIVISVYGYKYKVKNKQRFKFFAIEAIAILIMVLDSYLKVYNYFLFWCYVEAI